MTELYFRSWLQATSTGQTEPSEEIEWWLAQLCGVLDGQFDADLDTKAYELLASRWALKRVRPELLIEAAADQILHAADNLIESSAATWTEAAVHVPNPAAWLEQARVFETWIEEQAVTAVQAAETGQQLIVDLDEADLVLVACAELGLDNEAFAQGLKQCNGWLAEHAELFIDAGIFTQSVGLSLRSDLSETDKKLATTGMKYVHLLDALEATEHEMFGLDVEPFDASAVGGFFTQVSKAHDEPVIAGRIGDWLPPAVPVLRVAARTEETPRVHWQGFWTEPSDRFFARLVIPQSFEEDSSEQVITVTFYRSEDKVLANELDGKNVELAGVASQIEKAVARFRVKDLRDTGADPSLRVDSQFWSPVEDPS